ncbi:MAG: adenosine deaminase [Proteobacteria bacterium]|nr:adenosine deaminase [Pseudomonadota bacterium]
MKPLAQLIREIPKAELHCHIEGTLEPELMFELAQKNNIQLPYATPQDVRKAYHFTDLQSFLDIYYQAASVLCTEQDFYDLTWAYLLKAKVDNVCHTEIFFDPQTHTARGIPFAVIVNGITHALTDAKQKLNITSHLIMCFLRHLSEEAAFDTLNQGLPYKDKIIAVGLDSGERGNPPEKFKNVFQEAIKHGFLTVAHAGEEGPAENIWNSLRLLKAKRIEHGVHCTMDPSLIAYLKEHQIPLTVCPLSNVKLRVIDELKNHNLKTLLRQGLCITLNSDDAAYFGGYVVDNFLASAEQLNLNAEDIVQLAKNSIQASFIDETLKATYLRMISMVAQKFL